MGRIEWDESFSVHHEELDSQHKKLLGLYNNLHESLLHGTIEEATEQKKKTLDSLVDYIEYHFQSEEQHLKELNYADYEEHCLVHQNFSNKIKTLQKDIENGNMVFTTSLIKLLRNWILDHILKEDKAYSIQLKP